MAHILISGAGVAGPALALLLVRAGHQVSLIERASGLRLGGQAVDLRGAGRTVVEAMGLMPAVRALALRQRGMSWVDARGRARARMGVDAFAGEGFISEIEILRGDLAQIMYDATRQAVQYEFGNSVVELRQDDQGVDVAFESGPRRRFDLVVGADGLASTTRRLEFGEGGMRSLGCLIAWFTAPDPGDLDGWYEMYLARGGRNASLRPGRLPGEAKAALGLRIAPGTAFPSGRDEQRSLLRSRFAGLGWRVPELLSAAESADDFAFAEIGQVHLPSWSRGRVVLLGDAAASPSPLTGLGTSVALVQAYVLAGELAAAGGDHRRAFARYEQVCRPYVDRAQEMPPGGAAGFAPMSEAMIRLQTLSMRLATRWPMRPMLQKQFGKAADVVLPDYDLVATARRSVPPAGPVGR
ncbi:FAD-dependent monooxygenase [Microlunatus ginsengisoli]|uniref:FAD-dependent monooxygenase n=1 Tax=Microlunatus ginsengisoli TaxID=363863 RepID=A0ABP7ANK7_9ACTN